VTTELIDEHIRSLGLKNLRQYRDWCIKSGFTASTNKSARKLSLEQAYVNDHRQRNMLKSHRIIPFKTLIEEVKKGKRYDGIGIGSKIFDHFNQFRKTDTHKANLYLEVLLFLDTCSKLTSNVDMIQSIAYLFSHSEKWLKPYNTWKPKSHNIHKQLSSFVRHLLAKYKIPAFMDIAWEMPKMGVTYLHKEKTQAWFIHIGMGKNIRTAENLPCTLSKKEAHYFLKAPNNFTILEAIRWGQILALDGDKKLISALRETKLMRAFTQNEFCLQIIRFFINHPMLDRVHVQPIIDYIWNQKFEQQRVFIERGVAHNQGPPQPNFSMTGRTAEALLDQVERWHQQLGKEISKKNLQWEHHPIIKDYEYITGTAKKKNMKIWRIEQLVNHQELIVEGRAMKHCVASYGHSCQRRSCSIWSLNLNDSKHITIDLSRELHIQQMRGKNNRVPNVIEMNIIKRWATKERLSIGW
jgi:hypothetical protein